MIREPNVSVKVEVLVAGPRRPITIVRGDEEQTVEPEEDRPTPIEVPDPEPEPGGGGVKILAFVTLVTPEEFDATRFIEDPNRIYVEGPVVDLDQIDKHLLREIADAGGTLEIGVDLGAAEVSREFEE